MLEETENKLTESTESMESVADEVRDTEAVEAQPLDDEAQAELANASDRALIHECR